MASGVGHAAPRSTPTRSRARGDASSSLPRRLKRSISSLRKPAYGPKLAAARHGGGLVRHARHVPSAAVSVLPQVGQSGEAWGATPAQHAGHTPAQLPRQGSAVPQMTQEAGRNVWAKASTSVATAAGLYQFGASRARANGRDADPVYSRQEASMRWTFAVLLILAGAGVAGGQVLWGGVAAGTSWEWQAPTAPNQNFLHSTDSAPSAFVAFPVDQDTLLRLQVCDLPHEIVINGLGWPGHLRGYTIGADYFFTNALGESTFSAGLGSYKLNLKSAHPPAGYEQAKFGWYFGVGQWFRLSRRARVTADLTMHRTTHADTPTIVALTAGLAFSL